MLEQVVTVGHLSERRNSEFAKLAFFFFVRVFMQQLHAGMENCCSHLEMCSLRKGSKLPISEPVAPKDLWMSGYSNPLPGLPNP